MEKEWKSGEAIWHMKQAERNALDVAAMNKLNEIIDVATLRQRVQELEEETLWQARKRSDVITERDALRQRVQELEQQLTEVRLAERERCAKVCEDLKKNGIDYFMADSFAAAIRAME